MLGDDADQREAINRCEMLGAYGSAARARERMRAQGLSDVPQGRRRAARSNAAGLTAREQEVLGMLAAGLSNVAMARRLHRSVRTVEHHVAALLAKLEVDSRHDAVERARRERLIDP